MSEVLQLDPQGNLVDLRGEGMDAERQCVLYSGGEKNDRRARRKGSKGNESTFTARVVHSFNFSLVVVISVLYNCLEWYKRVLTNLYHDRQLYNTTLYHARHPL